MSGTSIAAPLLLGYLFNWGLYGVMTIQVYVYYATFPRDALYMKLLVYSLFLLETTQTIIVTSDAFNTFVRNFGDTSVLMSIQHIWLAVPVFTGVVSGTVQIYYAFRIYILSQSKPLGIIITTMALLQGSSAIAAGVQAHIIGSFSEVKDKSFITTCIWLIGSAICDTLVAGCMIFFLMKRDTGMDITHELITRLIRLVVETGTLTAAAATVDVVLFLVPNQSNYVCAALILAKLYSNSLLVLFNSRVRIVSGRTNLSRSQRSTPRDLSKSHRRCHLWPLKTHDNGALVSSLGTSVHVQVETWTDSTSEPEHQLQGDKHIQLMENMPVHDRNSVMQLV